MAQTISRSDATEKSLPDPKPPRRRRWLWGGLGAAIVASASFGAWYVFRPQSDNVVRFNGRIEGYETDVSTKSAGRVQEVTVREGDPVRKGQLLARLDDQEIRSELQAATAQVDATKRRQAEAQGQITVIQQQLAEARVGMQQSVQNSTGRLVEGQGLVATAQAALEQAQARVAEAQALVEQARVDRDRYAKLAQAGADTTQRSEQARTAYNTAVAALQSREAAVEETRRAVEVARGKQLQAQAGTLDPERQQTQVSRLQAQLQQARQLLAAAQADVKTASANRQLIQTRLNNLTVTSPIDGVVTVRSVEPGTVVLPSRSLLRVVDLNSVYMRGFVPEGEISLVQIGRPARVILDGNRSFNAQVAAVDAKASFTPENIYFQRDRVQQVFGVRLSITQPNGVAKPGMPADAEVFIK